MQLISDSYCSLNKQLHTSNEHYGVSGKRHAAFIYQMSRALETTDILDYGCGKSTLARNLPFTIKQYDPAVAKYAALPEPADIVVCTDVLEHIEPELIDNVLAHLQKLTKKAGFFTVATRPAKKILADGRNAHLIVEPANWWLDKFTKLFEIVKFTREQNQEFSICVEPLRGKNELV